jgi:hypothetical protein
MRSARGSRASRSRMRPSSAAKSSSEAYCPCRQYSAAQRSRRAGQGSGGCRRLKILASSSGQGSQPARMRSKAHPSSSGASSAYRLVEAACQELLHLAAAVIPACNQHSETAEEGQGWCGSEIDGMRWATHSWAGHCRQGTPARQPRAHTHTRRNAKQPSAGQPRPEPSTLLTSW